MRATREPAQDCTWPAGEQNLDYEDLQPSMRKFSPALESEAFISSGEMISFRLLEACELLRGFLLFFLCRALKSRAFELGHEKRWPKMRDRHMGTGEL